MQSPDYYRNPESNPSVDQSTLDKLETNIANAYVSWEALEALT